jgi:hypothetical protein
VAATGLLALALGATACSDRELFEEGSLRLYEVKTMVSVSSNDRLDLLFVLDNSLGMADKHRLLAEALPDFFARLLAVSCEDPSPGTSPSPTTATAPRLVAAVDHVLRRPRRGDHLEPRRARGHRLQPRRGLDLQPGEGRPR